MNHRTKALGAIAKITSGGTPDRSNAAYWNGNIPWVKTAQIQNCTITEDDVDEWITRQGLDGSSTKIIPKGTILMAMYGQGKTRGQVAILGIDAAINQACAAIILHDGIERDYVYQQLLYRYESIRALSNTGGQENLSAELIREIAFPIPPLREQQYIAAKLSDWDSAIEKTERLIVAKERSNRDLVLKILVGDFPMHKLSEHVNRVTRKNTTLNNHPLTISGREGLVSQSLYFDKRIAANDVDHYTLLKRGEFAYNRSYSSGYPYGAIKRLDAHEDGIVSSLYLCFSLKPDAQLLGDYLVCLVEAGGLNREIRKIAQEGARNHGLLNVATDDFFAMRLPVPPLEYQARVVQISNDAARELNLLNRARDSLRAQKRGLMQKLLTDHWRVKEKVEAHA